MKIQQIIPMLLLLFVMALLVSPATSLASGDFDWAQNLNIRAEADPSGFRARLSSRFNIGDAQVRVVLNNVENPADAYMVFRLGEMSSRPADYVLGKYKSAKGRGWGALAKSLGIKPGSKQFKDLKYRSDFYHDDDKGKGKKKNKKKDKGKRKG